VSRVSAALGDPHWRVNGGGLAELEATGIVVETGLMVNEATELIAPFTTLMTQHRPWVIAKWAMTLDGKLATREGNSQWITSEASRAAVHQLRSRVDAIIVGRGTANTDDPLLTARPPGARVATRIVLDSAASLPMHSQLVATASEAPVLVVASTAAPAERVSALREAGVEVWQHGECDRRAVLRALLDELGRRQMTNAFVEGGGEVFGAFFDLGAVDEVHAFIAPKIVGGPATTPVAGHGVAWMVDALQLTHVVVEQRGDDAYIHARVAK
jgi:diaminohydroxyphosphoribosylaminopyrimidine deaminase/5-amino-6-(5-phosphoribosylamino)uracil reductase